MTKTVKPFWFKFNPEKWISGTYYLSHVGQACYLRLLIYQFENGAIPDTARKCMDVCGIPDRGQWDTIWSDLQHKFEPDDTGRKINPTMAAAREEAIKHYAQRQRASAAGGRKRSATRSDTRSDTRSGTRSDTRSDTRSGTRSGGRSSSSSSSIKERSELNKKPGRQPESLDEVRSYAEKAGLPLDCEKFFDWGESGGWARNGKALKNWQAAARNAAKDWARDASNLSTADVLGF